MNMLTTTILTMSSREIADLTGKSHSKVMRDIRVMIDDLEQNPDLDFVCNSSTYVSDSSGQSYPCYELDRDTTECLLTGYSSVLRMKVIKRWKQLESTNKPALPTTKELALMVVAAEEEKEAALLLAEEKSRQVESLENLFHNGGTIAQFAKQLNGVNSQKINHWLYTNTKWLYDENNGKLDKHGREKAYAWRCASYARDKYLTETNYNVDRQGLESMVKYEVQLLADGKKWLFKKYTEGKLPMKNTWNGEFTHEKDLI